MNHYLCRFLRSSLVIVLLYTISASTLNAQKIKLVKDIRTLENPEFGSYPASFIKANDRFFFTAYTNETGRELWVSDGTDAGTRMVKDLTPGPSSDFIDLVLVHHGILYFTFNGAGFGHELWRSDGTANGTFIIKDINKGQLGSTPDNFSISLDKVLFFATDANGHRNLWVTDGTTSGTTSHSLGLYRTNFTLYNLSSIDSIVYFFSQNKATKECLLHKYNPSHHQLDNIHFTSEKLSTKTQPEFKVVSKGIILYAKTTADSAKLWHIDGLTNNVREATLPSNQDSIINDVKFNTVTHLGESVVFFGHNKNVGIQLWSLNAKTLSFQLVAVFPLASDPYPNPSHFTVFHNKLFFRGLDYGLWCTDGTAVGTSIINTINGNRFKLKQTAFDVVNDQLVSIATINQTDYLFTSDGSAIGTQVINTSCKDLGSLQPTSFVCSDSVIYFSAHDAVNGYELWRSDASCDGTRMIKNIFSKAGQSNPSHLTMVNGSLFFSAQDDTSGSELWLHKEFDLTTQLLFDFTLDPNENTTPQFITPIGDKVVFTSSNSNNGIATEDLWISDGTKSGTHLLKRFNLPKNSFIRFTILEHLVFFIVRNKNYSYEMWVTDGTTEGTNKIFTGNSYLRYTNYSRDSKHIMFNYGGEIWTTDIKTSGGSKHFDLAHKKCNVWNQSDLVTANNITYFSAWDATNRTGGELWCRDGNTGEVRLVKDINPGKASSNVSNFFAYKSRLFFQVDRNSVTELWITNGTEKGTYKVKTLLQSPRLDYELVGDRLFIKTRNHFDIDNLWITDGTESGTMLVTEYFWLTGASKITSMVVANDLLYFTLTNVDYGEELWQSDGTKEGTFLVEDLMPGSKSSSPKELTVGHNKLYFSAEHPKYGRELFYVDVPATIKSDIVNIEPYTLFPNPAIDEITIEYEHHEPGEKHTVEIRNILGQQIQVVQSTLNPFTLDISGLRSGTYFFQIDEYSVKKVVVY